MSKEASITHTPKRQLRLVLVLQLLWIAVVCILGGWWGSLLIKQSLRIDELEKLAGAISNPLRSNLERAQRMVFWEFGTFFVLLLVITAILFWLYWREMKRTKALQAFFASVTHELRTPLTSIRLQAESIAEGLSQANSREATLIQRLLEDTTRLESQVERTLELARLEGGGAVYSQSLKLRSSIGRILNSLQEAHGNRLEIRTSLKQDVILADPVAIQVIVRNLLENAVRHSKQEKVVVEISSDSKDGGVELRIRDNGSGFQGDPRSLGKIFQKGSQSQGTGVGLYLVRVLMKRMGGHVEFRTGSGFESILWFQRGRADG